MNYDISLLVDVENSIKACDRFNRFRFNGCQWNLTRTITQIVKQYNMKYGKKIVIDADGEWSEKMDTQMEISFEPLSLRIALDHAILQANVESHAWSNYFCFT